METDLPECVNIINDVRICPKCHNRITYDYVRYHHIGRAHCEHCGYHSPEADYLAKLDFAGETLCLAEKNAEPSEYHLVGDSIYNAYNQAAVLALLREIGLKPEQLKQSFQNLKIVESRYVKDVVGGITLITHMAKGHNPVANSCICDYIHKEPGTKELILMLEDRNDKKNSMENLTWIYDTDFQFLNEDKIKRIIVAGICAQDFKLRLLLGGVPEEKIVCVREERQAKYELQFNCERIYLLHELYSNQLAEEERQSIIGMIKKPAAEKFALGF